MKRWMRAAGLWGLGVMAMGASAQSGLDPSWEALAVDGRYAELEAGARVRLQARPDDPQATLALAMVATAHGESAALEAALQQADACVRRHPAASDCQLARGNVLATQASTASMFKAMGLAGSMREAFVKAVELDPLSFEARTGLTQFYLSAPGVAGGSVAKARELAADAQQRQPEHARLLRARIAISESQWALAEQELAAVKVGDDQSLARARRTVVGALGLAHLRAGNPPKARETFERLQSEHPGHALGPYGLGRALTDAGAFDEAIQALERSRGLQGANNLPIDYRLALAWLGKGDKSRARPLLERFVAQGRGNPSNLEDAKKRLANLG